MLILDSTWQKVRDRFTEAEKSQLREVATSRTICPKGVVIDEDRLSPDMLVKATRLLLRKGSRA
jgi:hypothetical protein